MANRIKKIIKNNIVYSGKLVKYIDRQIELDDGKIVQRDIVDHPGAVAIIAITKDNKIVLIKQFRIAPGKFLFEVPAGIIDKGENLEECAARELKEETGYRSDRIEIPLSAYASPGYSSELLTYAIAWDAIPGQAEPEEDEIIETHIFSLPEIENMIKTGEIEDNKTIVAIYLIKQRLNCNG